MSRTMKEIVDELMSTGKMPPDLMPRVMSAMKDPAALDDALEQMRAIGADTVGSGPPLDIRSFYRPAPGTYELRWELPSHLPLPVAWDELDRETQFFVLFQEWSRREMEGMMALIGGDVDRAESIFEECLERARQIEVAELEARTWEDFMRVAQRRGDRAAELEFSVKAVAARRP